MATILSSDGSIYTSSFLAGAIQNVRFNNNILVHPLSSIFSACVYGTIYSFAAALVAGWVPRSGRFVIPVLLCLSTVYLKTKKDKTPLNSSSAEPFINIQLTTINGIPTLNVNVPSKKVEEVVVTENK